MSRIFTCGILTLRLEKKKKKVSWLHKFQYRDLKPVQRSLQQLYGEGGTVFRFMLPQQELGEHPLSPGMTLLISAAINQFSPSHQPHQHPPRLLLPSLSTAMPTLLCSFSSSVCRNDSQLWMGAGGWISTLLPSIFSAFSLSLQTQFKQMFFFFSHSAKS